MILFQKINISFLQNDFRLNWIGASNSNPFYTVKWKMKEGKKFFWDSPSKKNLGGNLFEFWPNQNWNQSQRKHKLLGRRKPNFFPSILLKRPSFFPLKKNPERLKKIVHTLFYCIPEEGTFLFNDQSCANFYSLRNLKPV